MRGFEKFIPPKLVGGVNFFNREEVAMEENKKEAFVSTVKAVEMVNKLGYGKISRDTIIYWCKNSKIGKKIGGRWKVNIYALKTFLGVSDE